MYSNNNFIPQRATSYSDALTICETGLSTDCSLFNFDWISNSDERTRAIEWCAQDMAVSTSFFFFIPSTLQNNLVILPLLRRTHLETLIT